MSIDCMVPSLTQPLQFIENLATQPDYVFKILVVGNSYVGKSSFLMRLCTNAFSARYSSTIGEQLDSYLAPCVYCRGTNRPLGQFCIQKCPLQTIFRGTNEEIIALFLPGAL